jgi:hypothetical protein
VGPDLLTFIDRYIRSVEQLEILFLLESHPQRLWTPHAVSAELRSNEASAGRRLHELARDGILAVARSQPAAYRYAAGNGLDETIRKLTACYSQFRLRILERIYKKPDGLRDFAEAFRVFPVNEPR